MTGALKTGEPATDDYHSSHNDERLALCRPQFAVPAA
jgi:hypothetical protein